MDYALGSLLIAIRTHEKVPEVRTELIINAIRLAVSLKYKTGIREEEDGEVKYIVLPNDIGEVGWHNTLIVSKYDGGSTDAKYEKCEKYVNYVNKRYK